MNPRLIAPVIAFAFLAACSSGPTPMQRWQVGPGGKDLAKVKSDTLKIAADSDTLNFAALKADGFALFIDATKALGYPPPADAAAYKTAMNDALNAGAALAFNPSGGYSQAQADMGKAASIAKGAPWGQL
jgi:hypothetical protein